MWLTGRLGPDHKTIADIQKDKGRTIPAQNTLTRNRESPSERETWS
jgi:hypothetical protein